MLRPVDGHAGIGVVQLRLDDPNLSSLIEQATGHGRLPIVVQDYLDAVRHGNTRLFVVDGEVIGAVVRFPGREDFRIGAPAELADVTESDRALVARMAPELRRLGLWLVGLDVIDVRLIEVNVTSPGAMRKADAALGTRFAEEVIVRLERSSLGQQRVVDGGRGEMTGSVPVVASREWRRGSSGRDFRLIWTAELVSQTGTQVSALALPVVRSITGR